MLMFMNDNMDIQLKLFFEFNKTCELKRAYRKHMIYNACWHFNVLSCSFPPFDYTKPKLCN